MAGSPPWWRRSVATAEYRRTLGDTPVTPYEPPQGQPASDNGCSVARAKGRAVPARATEHALSDAYQLDVLAPDRPTERATSSIPCPASGTPTEDSLLFADAVRKGSGARRHACLRRDRTCRSVAFLIGTCGPDRLSTARPVPVSRPSPTSSVPKGRCTGAAGGVSARLPRTTPMGLQ